MRAWEEILTPADRAFYERKLWGARQSFRDHPAVLVSHLASLFDLNAKYATVIPLAEATDYLAEVQPARKA